MIVKPFRHPHLTEMDRVARARRKESREKLDLDVDAFVRQVKALPVFKDCPRSITRTKVVLAHGALATGGRAYGNKLARVRVSLAAPMEFTLATIVHELVHCALPEKTGHNERFRRTLARAVLELWHLEVDPNPKEESGRVAKYGLDLRIESALGILLRTGAVDYPKRAPAPDESATKALRRAIRAAHASKMLAKAETRLKRAETIAKKWRAKVKRLTLPTE